MKSTSSYAFTPDKFVHYIIRRKAYIPHKRLIIICLYYVSTNIIINFLALPLNIATNSVNAKYHPSKGT